MSKVLYHVTMSLDGFIAAPGDDMSWLHDQVGGANPMVDDMLCQIGALLIGANTFGPASAADGEPYGGAWTGPMFVLTHDPAPPAVPGFTFLSGELADAVATAKAAAGDKYVVILGATTAKRCLQAGLLDEILVHVAPVLLGDGVRLYEQAGNGSVRLEWINRSDTSKVTNLWLRVAK